MVAIDRGQVQIKLYLDEDVSSSVSSLLRSRGYDAISAQEVGHLAWSDPEHLTYAAAQRRVLVSYNAQDYFPLTKQWFLSHQDHAGVIISHRQYSRARSRPIVEALTIFLNTITAEDMVNMIRYLEEFIQDAH